jgi:hypothetical protein
MDYLIKMKLAQALILQAISELKDVDGLDSVVEGLREANCNLREELNEYTSHAELNGLDE